MQYGIPIFELILAGTALFALSAQKAAAQEEARDELRQTFQLAASSRVEVLSVNDQVTIETSDSDVAEVEIVRLATRQRDLKYHPVNVEYTAGSLVIRGKEDRAAYGRGIHVRQQVKLRIPRRVSLLVKGIGGPVQVGELEGPVKVERVSGPVTIGPMTGALTVAGTAGDLRVSVRRMDQSGIEISHVGGRVELRFAEAVNAELMAKSIGGDVQIDLPKVDRDGSDGAVSMSAHIGGGGAPISIRQVSGTVRLSLGL